MDPTVGAVLFVAFVVALVGGLRYLSRPRRHVRDEPDPSDSAGA